ncbi:DNA-3-methyladenine glycosylase [Chryseobacterium indoltheticum]|uniref:DNA-3-methyladenine glycosylase n=1 Tax=Chryseobacterium indoltheticum TaxID=254 RepID=UPI0040411E46
MKIPLSYYLNPDVAFLAKDLLGKIIFTRTDNGITAGIIVETEAYFGTGDKASHAYGGAAALPALKPCTAKEALLTSISATVSITFSMSLHH